MYTLQSEVKLSSTLLAKRIVEHTSLDRRKTQSRYTYGFGFDDTSEVVFLVSTSLVSSFLRF